MTFVKKNMFLISSDTPDSDFSHIKKTPVKTGEPLNKKSTFLSGNVSTYVLYQN